MSLAPTGIDNQPLQTIEWVDPAILRANSYNPNHVAPTEMALLKVSILEDGWTQPIVVRADNEIVDGFHRFTLATTDEDVMALTDGYVPVVRLTVGDMAHQRMSTIRHNRARGSHIVSRMGEIVRALLDEGLSPEEIAIRLGMEDEEVERLADTAGMTVRGAAEGFNKGWTADTQRK
jgi:ParB-like chromosome segregation protein Spo0J